MLRLLWFPFAIVLRAAALVAHTAWRVLTTVLGFTGRVVAGGVGLVTMALGLLLSWSGVGAVVGIPLVFLGALLGLRAVF